jgi:transcriptional regulator with XRE-family HTH domain
MVYDHQSTVRSRYVGQALARASQRAGQNGSDMATLLRWSPSKVSRLLSGKRAASNEDVAAFLALCHVTGPARDELLALNPLGYELTWWQDHGTRPPAHFPALADNEAAAVQITCFGNTLVPDLLRTPGYASAVLAARPTIPGDEIEERVAATQRRQRILDRSYAAPEVQVFLTEYALTHAGAGDEVMSDQAHHLLRLAVRPEMTIRVVPDTNESIGVHECAPFTLLEFTEHQPAVYLEHATSTAFLEQPETIATYRNIISKLNRLALSRNDSRKRIAEVAQHRASTQHGTRPAQAADSLAIWATS